MDPLRTLECDEYSGAQILRSKGSAVQAVLHTQQPVVSDGPSALDAAESYLRTDLKLLGPGKLEAKISGLKTEQDWTDAGVGYQLLCEKRHCDVTTVTYQQTCAGLPVWQKGVSVHLKQTPVASTGLKRIADRFLSFVTFGRRSAPSRFDVICSQANCVESALADFKPPPAMLAQVKSKGFEGSTAEELARALGIASDETAYDVKSLKIRHQHLTVYRYEAA